MRHLIIAMCIVPFWGCGTKNEVTKGETSTTLRFVFDTAAKRPVGLVNGVYIYESLQLSTTDAGGSVVPVISSDKASLVEYKEAQFSISNDAKNYKLSVIQAPAGFDCRFKSLGEGPIEAITAQATTPLFCYVNFGKISGLSGDLVLQIGEQKTTVTGAGGDQDLLWPFESLAYVASTTEEAVTVKVDTDRDKFLAANPGVVDVGLLVLREGSFTFSEKTPGFATKVQIATQPTGQTCTIATSGTTDKVIFKGSGAEFGTFYTYTYKEGDMTATITCKTADSTDPVEHTIAGTVSGLDGTVTLQLNAANDLEVSENGDFAFATKIADGADYTVSIKTQPSGQTCTLKDETGKATADVSVVVVCETNPAPAQYTLGGTVTGLVAGETIKLQDFLAPTAVKFVTVEGGADAMTPVSFTFPGTRGDGWDYQVDVLPEANVGHSKTCTGTNDMGIISGANVTDIAITCSASP